MNRNYAYLEVLSDLMPLPLFIEYIRQCYRFRFDLEENENERVSISGN